MHSSLDHAGEVGEQLLHRAERLQVIGSLLVIVAGIYSIFIWMGLEAGSQLWLWLSVVDSLIGLMLIGIGQSLKDKADRAVS